MHSLRRSSFFAFVILCQLHSLNHDRRDGLLRYDISIELQVKAIYLFCMQRGGKVTGEFFFRAAKLKNGS